MTDVDLMFRSLRLAWIPRLLTAGDCNWCTVPYHFFRKLGGGGGGLKLSRKM